MNTRQLLFFRIRVGICKGQDLLKLWTINYGSTKETIFPLFIRYDFSIHKYYAIVGV